jgi:ABC-type nickel/cobalt efflux system permease component RcnA
MNLWAAWLLGLMLGMRHACEPDHLAAISTLVSENPRKGFLLGAFWGVGHTLSLFGVALALVLLQSEVPPRMGDAFELLVAFMLFGLGVRAVLRAAREQGPAQEHSHGHEHHVHATAGKHLHLGSKTLTLRPLLVGLVHGLAGSGALTALAMAAMPGNAARLWYVLLFGLGSVLGMGLLSGAAGLPLARLGRNPNAMRALAGATGLFSIALGVAWGWPLFPRVLFGAY